MAWRGVVCLGIVFNLHHSSGDFFKTPVAETDLRADLARSPCGSLCSGARVCAVSWMCVSVVCVVCVCVCVLCAVCVDCARVLIVRMG